MDSVNILNGNSIKKINNEMKTFNRLLNLQKLVKKESALKELFIDSKNDCENKIEKLCSEINMQKIEILNILQKNESVIKKIKYNLITNKTRYLKELNLFIEKFIIYLWDNPLLIAKILINSNKIDVKYHLAPLITNYFYENILSNNHIEDQLLYIISILLENEINELKDINSDIFLNNTPCGYILGELIEKKDVKDFFKIILKDLIEDLETINGKNVFLLDIEKMESFLIRKYNQKDNNKNNYFFNIDTINLDNNDKIKILNKLFFEKYAVDLTITELKTKNSNENNKIFKEYINSLTKDQYNESLYSNKNFIDQINNITFSKEILLLFEKNFFEIINFLEKILDNFLNNIDLVPYSIRCICKMILLYTQKKFPNSTNFEIFSFFSKFLINNLFIPILIKPDTNALISNYIISNNTLNNLKIISEIFLKFSSFKLYTENDIGCYAPFNIFFINSINKLIEFYTKLTEINFPNFLDELINGNILKENYKYNYFKEHKDELFFHRSVFLTTYHISILIKNINNMKEKIFNEVNDNDTRKFQKIFERLNKEDKLELLKVKTKENISYDDKNENLLNINYFVISNLLYNERFEILFNKKKTQKYFELKDNINDYNKDNINQSLNNIIKIKNSLCTILDNCDLLEKTDFIENNKTYDTMSILNKLKLFLKSFDFVMDNNIPTEWYIKLLFDFLFTLPEDYRANDFQKLYDELENDIINSIKQYNFEELSTFICKMEYAKKNKIYYDHKKESLIEINLNNKVIKIIENGKININLYCKLNEIEKELDIYSDENKDEQLEFLSSLVFKEDEKKPKLCRTIQSFIKHFPNLNQYIKHYQNNCCDVIELEKRLKIPIKLKIFFKAILKFLKNYENNIDSKNELYLIYDKIYDYVMSMLYNFIFPDEEDIMDSKLYVKMSLFSWIEPKNIIQNYQLFNFDLVLPDIINFFEGIDKEKSPRKKMINMNNIFISINKLIKFSTNNNLPGLDDQMPLFSYAFIKARPKKIFTNIKFMEIYMGSKINKIEGGQLTFLKSIGLYIIGINYSKVYYISEKEFEQKCSEEVSKKNEEKKEEKNKNNY